MHDMSQCADGHPGPTRGVSAPPIGNKTTKLADLAVTKGPQSGSSSGSSGAAGTRDTRSRCAIRPCRSAMSTRSRRLLPQMHTQSAVRRLRGPDTLHERQTAHRTVSWT